MIVRTWLSRLIGFFRGSRLDERLDDEVRFHLEMLTQDFERRGLSRQDARRAACRQFGGVTQMKEAYRDQRGLPVLETLIQDVRYGLRGLVRTPGFTLGAVLTLALGIGANTAIFSVVNAVLLQPLPYVGADRIVQMYRNNGGLWDGHTARRFEFFREHLQSFQAFAAWRATAVNVAAGPEAELVDALAVSHGYFDVFGGIPLHGRLFHPEDDVPNGPRVVILKEELWRRVFGGSPGVIGSTLLLEDHSYTVVGVVPEAFDSVRSAELYVPLQPSPIGPGGGFNYRIAGRLKPGVTLEQANAESGSAFAAYKASLPSANFGSEAPPQFLPLQTSLSRSVRPALLLMLGAVGMLLLIACANAANLLLARAFGRGREISLRAALGAGRGRIIRQLVTESILLFLAGGACGLALAYWAVPALLSMTPPGYLPAQEVRIDGVVLLATLGVSLVNGLVFGLAPALSLSRPDLVEALKADGTRSSGSGRSQWLRHGLVVGEVALCMVLLVGAGLLIQTFLRLRAVDVGFDASQVLTARMSLAGERYVTADAVRGLFDRADERLQRIPGVRSVALVNGIPIERGLNLNFDRLDTPEVETHLTDWRYASNGYFETLGIEIVEGRGFDERDGAGAPKVAVVSQQFARLHYKDQNPIGQRIVMYKQDGPIEIVGIAKDLREAGLSGPVPALMYVPLAQASDSAVRTAHSYFQSSWVVKADRLSPELTHRVREELRAIEPRQPITALRSIDEVKAGAMAHETFQMTLLAGFAAIGLALAAAGIYGLVAYSVAQRTREIGIRMALGASRERILTLVLRQGAVLALAGVAIGIGAAVALTQTMQSLVFGVSTLDTVTFAVVAAVLVAVAVLASVVPALRAIRMNPVSALRDA